MLDSISFLIPFYLCVVLVFYAFLKWLKRGFMITMASMGMSALVCYIFSNPLFPLFMLHLLLPLALINLMLHGALSEETDTLKVHKKYRVRLPTKSGTLELKNIKRGVSIIGSAGSGKTESVVYNLMKHFAKHQFSGVIHDYKHFELTEMAHPLFQQEDIPFHIVSFDDIHQKVNPIAPRYLTDAESVNEVSRVLLENLLEQRESNAVGSSKFFNDAVEGLLGGLIWKFKTSHPEFCTLPHLIAAYQYLDADNLIRFLSSNVTSKGMANAFISGKDSERQTAGVMSTLANALKKISTERIFMTLSADEVSLDINNPDNPAVVAIVNNPKYETAYTPVIATILHTITKQMSVRGREPAFILMEEAPTIRLLNMHRIPATLRSYDIATIYVLQDKIQNDMMYGDKASRAILSNLSYQFFGKANDPDTAKYYERFFEIVKKPTISVSKSSNWDFDSRITKGEKEVSKIRSDEFFRLRQGEFISFADGKDRKVRFPPPKIIRNLPEPTHVHDAAEIRSNYENIHREMRQLLRLKTKT